MYKYKITICTPTYNRGYILDRLYESIKRQSFVDFEWIIYDDGSSDNTEKIVSKWLCDNNPFSIKYLKGENGGKCRAINRVLDVAQGEMFFVVDSDDYLTDDACQKINNWMESIRGLDDFCGVVGNRGQSETNTRNTIWKDNPETPWYGKPYRDATFFERYKEVSEYPIDGERAEVFWTGIFKKYPYPEFEGENFITPGVSWNRMAHDGYKIRVYEDIIWIWEYLDDGLTRSGSNEKFLKNPHGHGLWLREKSEFLHDSIFKRLKMYYTFYCDFSDRIEKEEIAECIGAPVAIIYLSAFVHRISIFMKKKRGS